MTIRLAGCLLVLAMGGSTTHARDALTLAATPSVTMGPATVAVQMTIEPDTDNRAVELVVDSVDFYRSSELILEGDRAPRITTVVFRHLPPGVYEMRATLLGQDRAPRALAQQDVHILGVGVDAPASK